MQATPLTAASAAVAVAAVPPKEPMELIRIEVEQQFDVPAEKLWQLLGRFCAISDWQSAVRDCVVTEDPRGIVRMVVMQDSTAFVEKLEHFSNEDRVMAYSILSSPIPLPQYRCEQRVTPAGSGKSKLVWSASFASDGSQASKDRGTALQALFNNGLAGMVRLVDSRL